MRYNIICELFFFFFFFESERRVRWFICRLCTLCMYVCDVVGNFIFVGTGVRIHTDNRCEGAAFLSILLL